AGVDDLYSYIFVVELLQRGNDRADRALHVSLDDEVEVLDLALLNLAEELLQRGAGVSGQDLFSELGFSVFGDLPGDLVFLDDAEFVAGFRYVVEAEDFHRGSRSGLADGLSLVVGHQADFARAGAGDYALAALDRTVGYQQRGDRALVLIQSR